MPGPACYGERADRQFCRGQVAGVDEVADRALAEDWAAPNVCALLEMVGPN
jgi:hypothetical protein